MADKHCEAGKGLYGDKISSLGLYLQNLDQPKGLVTPASTRQASDAVEDHSHRIIFNFHNERAGNSSLAVCLLQMDFCALMSALFLSRPYLVEASTI